MSESTPISLSFPSKEPGDLILIAKERMTAKLIAFDKALGNAVKGTSLGLISYCELEYGIFMNHL
jgi:hypothetical protein